MVRQGLPVKQNRITVPTKWRHKPVTLPIRPTYGDAMHSYAEALSLMLSHVRPVMTEDCLLSDAMGRITVEDLKAPSAFPAFPNSSMDGFAVIAADTKEATLNKPVALRLVGESAAGGALMEASLYPGQCVAIMTGGRLPVGADAIVPMEDTVRDGETIQVIAPASSGSFVRPIGADWQSGEVVCPAHTLLSAEHLPAVCALGLTTTRVKAKPRVGWVSTGAELVDDLTHPLGPTEIYNATAHFGRHCLQHAGADLVHQATTGDDPKAFQTEVQSALSRDVDLIISTGAVSVGAYDFVRNAIEDMGATVHVHRAKVRPGKPILFATFPNGCLFVGLPGNPVSTAMGFRMFVSPILRAMRAQDAEHPIQAQLLADITGPERLTVFYRAALIVSPTGQLTVAATPHQESFKTRSLLETNAWLVHPEGTKTLTQGTHVEVYPLWPSFHSRGGWHFT